MTAFEVFEESAHLTEFPLSNINASIHSKIKKIVVILSSGFPYLWNSIKYQFF